MLHYLDDLDSKMESMRAHFERDPEAEWSGYNSSLGRTLLNSEKILTQLAAPEQPAEPPSEPEVRELKVAAGEQ